MPCPALPRLQVGAYFEGTERVFSPMHSEPSLGWLEDIYVMAAKFLTTPAPNSPAPAIAA
jgi:hypothetical protein